MPDMRAKQSGPPAIPSTRLLMAGTQSAVRDMTTRPEKATTRVVVADRMAR